MPASGASPMATTLRVESTLVVRGATVLELGQSLRRVRGAKAEEDKRRDSDVKAIEQESLVAVALRRWGGTDIWGMSTWEIPPSLT